MPINIGINLRRTSLTTGELNRVVCVGRQTYRYREITDGGYIALCHLALTTGRT